jgi:hypothetical protein
VNEAQEIVELDAEGREVRVARLSPPSGSLPAPARQRASVPARAAAAAAAGGFVAGAAVVGIVGHRHRRALAVGGRRRRSLAPRRRRATGKRAAGAQPLQIVASRKVLLDIHLLGIPGSES